MNDLYNLHKVLVRVTDQSVDDALDVDTLDAETESRAFAELGKLRPYSVWLNQQKSRLDSV